MSSFLLIHGAGDVGWYWHLLEAELRARGHHTVAPDLPGDDDSLTLSDYAAAAVAAAHDVDDLVVVGQSFGAFTAPLVATRRPVTELVLVAGMIPAPGESPEDWWANTRYAEAVREQAARDEGLTGSHDPYVAYYHDVPRALAEKALSHERDHPSATAYVQPWPLDSWPSVPTRVILGTNDRFLPPRFLRRLTKERLGIAAEEITAGHCVALSRPEALAALLTTRAS
jgi:pimeloyl-ACP methyl ester carboxylesterase